MAFGKVKVDSIESTTRTISVDNIALLADVTGGTFATQAEAEAGTDNTKLMSPLRTAQAIANLSPAPTFASQAEAEAGTDTTKVMSPLRTVQAIDAQVVLASQAEAEAGTDSVKFMSPLRTAQAIASLSPAPTFATQAEAEAGTDTTKVMSPLTTKQAITALAASSTDAVLTRPKFISSREQFSTLNSTATTTLDLATSNFFEVVLAANITTFTWNNPPASGTAYAFTLKITQGASPYTVTWPAAVKWGVGVSPTISQNNGNVDLFTFVTHNGGTTWFGSKTGAYT
ncbi:MAG: hypothetical protein ACO24P_00265 [Candidatus Nanopelagicaceae bacterium]